MVTPILLVEDEAEMASLLQQGLEEEGYTVEWVLTGEEALARLERKQPALLVLDVRLPGMDGVEVCRQVRSRWPALPILMLTALDAVEDRVRGLRAGADDYLPKPFAFEELLARMEALLRRSAHSPSRHVLRDGSLVLDLRARTASCGTHPLSLSPREFDLLAHFMQHPRQALSRLQLYREVWGHDFDHGTNLVEVYVSYLRRKLQEAGCRSRIVTVWGRGYRYEPAEE
ncbi:response regulator transcription factor [Rhodothermus profundi]|uniref:Two-component system, OmpR family, response regulator MprA n=1 Tax=Rhodothermus profundi TaxID=633813 RepID=A0A1M6UJX1_9BACT|nr:response regulator transcription factor [Rhodothermus profundi]SHK69440.1 two-component system, OmpR family, response regulator MprA [Rhodothermus profundi]